MRMRLLLGAAIMVLAPAAAQAQSSTWQGPGTDFTDNGNWTPATTPSATATFDNTATSTTVNNLSGTLGEMLFSAGAPAFNLNVTAAAATFILNGAGITNNSGILQTFTHQGVGANFNFINNATAGNLVQITQASGNIRFLNNANAGSATINQNTGIVTFADNASASSATINDAGGNLIFNNNASAGTSTINLTQSPAWAYFNNSSTAGSATINVMDNTRAEFHDTASAGSAKFNLTGDSIVYFYESSTGGTSAFNLTDPAATLDLSATASGVNQIGSLEGTAGRVLLGKNTVSIGGNNQPTSFAGVITDCDGDCAAIPSLLPLGPGVLKKVGTGFFILTGGNTYTGGTIIDGGTLQIGLGGTTGSITGNVANNSALIFSRSNAYAFGGVISGSGTLGMTGGGTLTLSAAQTYSGATTINTGSTLALTGAGNITSSALTANGTFDISGVTSGASTPSLAGSGIIALGAKTFTISNASNATFSGAFTGTGGVTLAGGHQILTGNSPAFTGPTTINGGTLSVNGSIGSSPVTVASGGTLGGTGTVGLTSVNAGGTLAPGNSIGTLKVNGNLVFAANSIYRVEVAPAASDLTLVSGTASVNGAVEADFAAGTYAPGARYAIVTSTGTLSGTFSGLSTMGLPAGFSSSLAYDANNAYIVLSGGDARTGLIHARIVSAYIEDERLIRDAVFDHLLTPADGVRVWGHGFAASGTVGATDPMGHSHSGFIAGVDMPLGDGFTLGVAGAFTGYKLSMPSKASTANGQAGHAIAYIGWNDLSDGSGFMLKGGGEYGWGTVNTARQPSATETDRAHRDASTAQIFGEAAYRIHFIGADLEPHANLFWVMGQNGAFTETGGTSAMAGTGIQEDVTFAKLGVRGLGRYVDLGGMEIAPSLDIGWQAALSNSAPGMTVNFLSAPGTTALLLGSAYGNNAGTAQLGMKIKLGEDGELNAGYDGIFSMSGVDHAVTARLTWRF